MLLNGRTDIADESQRLWQQSAEKNSALPGVKAERQELFSLPVTAVEIIDSQGAEALKKPKGKYFTLELPDHFERGADSFSSCVQALSELIRRCISKPPENILVAALGNPDITPDALGSLSAGSILVTRHLKSSSPDVFQGFSSLSLCRPGVLGTSGIESARQVSILCRELRPELVLVIDALAGAELDRLCRTIQITDSGLAPGSGVGNDRHELSRDSLGVPVVAVGMPTVIDAASLGSDGLGDMFVTPRNIDSLVRHAARVIGYGVDLALHRGIGLSDIDMLVG